MTTSAQVSESRLRRLLRSTAGIAIAMAVMNIGTYAFQLVSARLLGPSQYGAVASMMALMMVLSVLQLGLQATAARRISRSSPSTLSFKVESAYVGDFHGPPLTPVRRRRTTVAVTGGVR